uniref:Uncharacterized protein n=1 Tax=Arundo donax TaxID=35708 RepID=A0A0A9CJM8_ARUDO
MWPVSYFLMLVSFLILIASMLFS